MLDDLHIGTRMRAVPTQTHGNGEFRLFRFYDGLPRETWVLRCLESLEEQEFCLGVEAEIPSEERNSEKMENFIGRCCDSLQSTSL